MRRIEDTRLRHGDRRQNGAVLVPDQACTAHEIDAQPLPLLL